MFAIGADKAAAAVSSKAFQVEEPTGGRFNVAFLVLEGRTLLGLVKLWAKDFGVRSLTSGVITLFRAASATILALSLGYLLPGISRLSPDGSVLSIAFAKSKSIVEFFFPIRLLVEPCRCEVCDCLPFRERKL